MKGGFFGYAGLPLCECTRITTEERRGKDGSRPVKVVRCTPSLVLNDEVQCLSVLVYDGVEVLAEKPWTVSRSPRFRVPWQVASCAASSFLYPRLLLPFLSTSFLKNCANLVKPLSERT